MQEETVNYIFAYRHIERIDNDIIFQIYIVF